MAWDHSNRKAEDAFYSDPEYKRNRPLALRRDGGRCVLCRSADRVQVDHIIPRTKGGGHALANLRTLCKACHASKTASEGGGGRNPNRTPKDPAPRPNTRW